MDLKQILSFQKDALIFQTLFGNNYALDTRSPVVELDLAARIGRMSGKEHCDKAYARCGRNYKDLIQQITKAEKFIIAQKNGNGN